MKSATVEVTIKSKALDPKQLKKAFGDPALFSLVNSYLNARVHAEVTRGEVDKIQRRILAEVPLFQTKGGRLFGTGERITDPRETYLCEDEEACQRYFDRCEEEEDKAGLRKDLEKGFCPALVAENLLVEIKHAIADIVCPIIGIEKQELFCQGDGVDTWEKFIDLTVNAVINHPNFEPVNMYAEAMKEQ